MEFGDHDTSLRAWEEGQKLWQEIEQEIVGNITSRHQDEIKTIKSIMPGRSGLPK